MGRAAQLSHIAELRELIDRLLRHADGIADHLSDCLRERSSQL